MATNSHRESAKILQFPVRGRSTAFEGASTAASSSQTGQSEQPMAVLGGPWYHDAAIAEAEKVSKH